MKQTQSLANDNKRKKRRILLGILIPLTVVGVALGTALPIAYCSNRSDIDKVTSLHISYPYDRHVIHEEVGIGGWVDFTIVDNLNNPVNDAVVECVADKPIVGLSATHVSDNTYKFMWTGSTAVGNYKLTISAMAGTIFTIIPTEVELDIVPQTPIEWEINQANFSEYFSSTFPTITDAASVKPEFAQYLNEHNVSNIKFSVDGLNIGANAFNGCAPLSNPTYPTTIEFNSATTVTIGNNAFENCANISQIIVSNNATAISIGDSAFKSCTSFTGFAKRFTTGQISISIGYDSFIDCASLNANEISDDVLNITDCTWIDGNDANSGYWLKTGATTVRNSGCLAVGALTVLDTLTNYAFYHCASVIECVFAASTTQPRCCFECINLEIVRFTNTTMGFTGAGIDAFENCAKLHDIYIAKCQLILSTHGFSNVGVNGGVIHGPNAEYVLTTFKNANSLLNWTWSLT